MSISIFCDAETEELIRKKIDEDENTGEQAGGSGHLSDISYHLDYISLKAGDDGVVEACYFYTLSVCSEFTMYPSNPPRVYRYRKSVWINHNRELLRETEKTYYSLDELPHEISWPMVQDEILQFLEKFLFTIEWEYGEGRAPFRYPPEFVREIDLEGNPQYACVIITEDDPADRIDFRSPAPARLPSLITSTINSRYG